MAEQAREVADERDAHVGVAGRGDGGGEPGPVGRRCTAQPGACTTSASGSSARSASTAVGTSMPSPRPG